jgi:hypothetical protein
MLTALLVLIGVCLGATGLLAGLSALVRAIDPQSELHRLERPVTAAERSRGVVRGAAVVSPETPTMGLCRIEHQHYVSGKNGGWRTDATYVISQQATLVREGTRYHLAFSAGGGPFEPLRMEVIADGTVATHLPDVAARYRQGRYRQHCAPPGALVFVEGCRAAEGLLSDCAPGVLGAERAPLRITTGSGGHAQPRIDEVAATMTTEIAGAAMALLAVLGWIWFVLRARPVVDPLLARAGLSAPTTTPPRELALVLVPLAVAAVQGVVAWSAPEGSPASVFQGGYTFAVAVSCGAILLAAAVHRRRVRLESAMRPVLAAPTVSLREARGEMVELCVRTTAEAPVVGPVSGKRRAWVRVVVYETYTFGKQSLTVQVAASARPRRIAVQDASGEGEVDPEGAEPDLRAVRKQFRADRDPALLARLLADFDITLAPRSGHTRWTVEESFLDPGEAVYLLGDARRVDDPKAAASYRGDATRPVVGGHHQGLILHAGDERSLLALLRRESRWLDLLGAASVGLALSVVGLAVVLATR